MSFWKLPLLGTLRKCKKYIGIDISKEIIEKNVFNYPERAYFISNAKNYIVGINADIVLCMDLLFHIMNEDDYISILENLCSYSDDWIIMYNWINNPFAEEKKITDGISQYYRNLSRYDYIFFSDDFELKKIIECPLDNYGALYFYRRFIY